MKPNLFSSTSGLSRRTALKGLAAAALAALMPERLWAAAAATFRRVRPSDPDWPSAAQWQTLASDVGGNLIKVQPLYNGASEPGANINNPYFLGDQPAGTQVSGWLDAWTNSPSAYAVKAQRTADVVAAVNFAREHRLRLVVKGAGHSYQGTSNAPDSLLVWTRAMNEVTMHDAFVPSGCEGKLAPVPAVSAGAGSVWGDLYYTVTQLGGRYVQGGGCADVGVAGLVQSGGFGNFSKGFGTAAAGLLEAEIVTADGVARTVNACSDPELFWAIKGGGGGSWGVITRVTLRTHDLPKYFGMVGGTIRAFSASAYWNLISQFVDFYTSQLFNPNWGEYITVSPNNSLGLSLVFQGLTTDEALNLWQPFFNWVAAFPRDYSFASEPGVGTVPATGWWDPAVIRAWDVDPRPGAPRSHTWSVDEQAQVGEFLYGYDSVWLPASLLDVTQKSRLVDALFKSSRYNEVQLHFNKGLAGAPVEAIAAARDTATNPAACEAFALAVIIASEGSAFPGEKRPAIDLKAAHQAARALDQAAAELRSVVPGAGSYVSESNYFNPNWSRDFWGDNYARLKAVKAKYDPDGLFFVHHGVGSEDWSPDGFTRVNAG